MDLRAAHPLHSLLPRCPAHTLRPSGLPEIYPGRAQNAESNCRVIRAGERKQRPQPPDGAQNKRPAGKLVAKVPKKPTQGVGAAPILRSREKWACIKGCGACCLLDKGPLAPPVEEILKDPAELQMYKSMVGTDGWCVHFDKTGRNCTIYEDRPRFCRVEPEVFHDLYGIEEHELDAVACSFCRDSIRDVYGGRSAELKAFERTVRTLGKPKK